MREYFQYNGILTHAVDFHRVLATVLNRKRRELPSIPKFCNRPCLTPGSQLFLQSEIGHHGEQFASQLYTSEHVTKFCLAWQRLYANCHKSNLIYVHTTTLALNVQQQSLSHAEPRLRRMESSYRLAQNPLYTRW